MYQIDPVIKQINTWMKYCEANHQLCKISKPATLPKRVLRLDDDARLCLFKSDQVVDKYCALSYCWGQSTNPFITTKLNISQMFSGISMIDLPQTIQDAVRVTRALGIRYLWVDALCIIQDSFEDWNTEAAKMCAVYQNAFLTISALHASGSNEGFLSKNLPGRITKLRSISSSNELVSIFSSPVLSHAGFSSDMSDEDRDRFPLFTRGWVLQERLLSQRIIHFAAGELIWECQSTTRCECQPESLGDGLLRRHGWVGQSEPKRQWRDICMEYSTLALTKATDKLPALLGLVRRFKNDGCGAYHAGIWLNDFLQSLCWQDRFLRRPKSLIIGIPTWSWASFLEPITFRDCPEWTKGLSAQLIEPTYCSLDGKSGDSMSITIETVEFQAFLGKEPRTLHYQDAVFVPTSPTCYFSPDLDMDWHVLCQRLLRFIVLSSHPSHGGKPKGETDSYNIEFIMMVVTPSVTSPGKFERIGLSTFVAKTTEEALSAYKKNARFEKFTLV